VSSDDCSDQDGGTENKHCQIANIVELHRCMALQNRTSRSNTKVFLKNHSDASTKKGNGSADELKFFHDVPSRSVVPHVVRNNDNDDDQ
jgi:hypothetical protein